MRHDGEDPDRAAAEAMEILALVRSMSDEFADFVVRLASQESPTHVPESQAAIQRILGQEFEAMGFETRRVAGRVSVRVMFSRAIPA